MGSQDVIKGYGQSGCYKGLWVHVVIKGYGWLQAVIDAYVVIGCYGWLWLYRVMYIDSTDL